MDYVIWFNQGDTNDDDKISCPSDPDIAGLGVIISFTVAAVLTTLAAIYAAFLDGMLGSPHAVLPKRMNRWLSTGRSDKQKARLLFWRTLLDRLMLAFADQRILTGFALLLSVYIKGGRKLEWYYHHLGHLNLVVFLSCLSSSSHLACVITLKQYFAEHRATARLRITLIILFALFVAGSINFSSAFKPFWFVCGLVNPSITEITEDDDKTYTVIMYIIPPLFTLYPYWVTLVQLSTTARTKVESLVHGITGWVRNTAVCRMLKRCTGIGSHWRIVRVIRAVFWFMVISNMSAVFCMQIGFVSISLAFLVLQKVGESMDPEFSCGLSNEDENKWGFGQTLPLFLLLQPAVSAFSTYRELKDDAKKADEVPNSEEETGYAPPTPQRTLQSGSGSGDSVALLSIPHPNVESFRFGSLRGSGSSFDLRNDGLANHHNGDQF